MPIQHVALSPPGQTSLEANPQFANLSQELQNAIRSMTAELRQMLATVSRPGLHRLSAAFLQSQYYIPYCLAPAAQRYHHNQAGGLLQHSLGTARIVTQISSLIPHMDRDLILVGALLHDLGKIKEMSLAEEIQYTDEGKLLGHIILGIQILGELLQQAEVDAVTRNKLLHMIASHHGHYEWQSPKKPRFLEAKVLHLADMMDAEIWKFSNAKPSFEGSHWSAYMRSIGSEVYLQR